jgi:hypothetical protein
VKRLVVLLSVLLAGCAAGPAEPRQPLAVPDSQGLRVVALNAAPVAPAAPEIYFPGAEEDEVAPVATDTVALDFEDADLRAVVARIAAETGRKIHVEDGVSEKVTISTCPIFWRDALDLVATLGRCDLDELPDGSFALSQPGTLPGIAPLRSLRDVVVLLGDVLQFRVLVLDDVKGPCLVDETTHLSSSGAVAFFFGFLREHGLHAARVGDIFVVSAAEIESETCSVAGGPRATFRAFDAPAAGWFELLERKTGTKVEHGDRPVNVWLDGVSAAEVQRASAIETRVPGLPRRFADLPEEVVLPTGGVVRYTLQATITTDVRGCQGGGALAALRRRRHRRDVEPLALVDGRVVAEGDELLPGVVIEQIRADSLVLADESAER